jgi:hypothetical protein
MVRAGASVACPRQGLGLSLPSRGYSDQLVSSARGACRVELPRSQIIKRNNLELALGSFGTHGRGDAPRMGDPPRHTAVFQRAVWPRPARVAPWARLACVMLDYPHLVAALYPPWSNTVLRLGLALVALGAVAVPVSLMAYVRSPWNTEQNQAIDQPVEFDHRHHVADDHIDCLYCHSGAEKSRSAGVPSTEVCMGCHSQIWNESPLLEKVRRSYFSGKPLPWNRVHELADFVYFDHSVHVQRGVGCVSCHGQVDEMSRVGKAAPLNMQWCLGCHRAAEAALLGDQEAAREAGLPLALLSPAPQRPNEPPSSNERTAAEPQLPEGPSHEAPQNYEPMVGSLFEPHVSAEYGRRGSVTSLTTCSACHR